MSSEAKLTIFDQFVNVTSSHGKFVPPQIIAAIMIYWCWYCDTAVWRFLASEK